MKLLCLAVTATVLLFSCHHAMTAITSINNNIYKDDSGNSELLGIHTKEDLQQSPFNIWFNKNYSDYRVDSITVNELKPMLKNKHFEIFMGTWCGDSQREVPRMFKLLEYAGVRPSQIKLIMIDDHDSTYKQSPLHEERGKDIHHVPDLLVYNGDKEINRIVESPVESLEKDLLHIVSNQPYQPTYRAAGYLIHLTKEKTAAVIMENKTIVADSLKKLVQYSGELNTLAKIWKGAKENDKAMLAYQFNAMLYPNDVNVIRNLARFNLQLKNNEAAIRYYKKVLELQPGNTEATEVLKLMKL